jgi:Tol biopolymer transport system component
VVFESDRQIYLYDVVLNTSPRQLTFECCNSRPVVSPDGTRVAFSFQGRGTDEQDIFVKDLGDDSPPRSLLTLDGNQLVTQWPTDTLIVFERGDGGRRDLWMVDISDPERPEARPYLTSESDLRGVTLSPDGGLAAYRSNEMGSWEIYLRSFPTPGERTLVSRDGGAIVGWSQDGASLYHDPGAGRPVRVTRLRGGRVPVVLTTDTLAVRAPPIEPLAQSLHPDGDRFIFAVPDEGAAAEGEGEQRLILVQNFATELARLVGGN